MYKPYYENPNYLIFDDGRIYSKYRKKFLKIFISEDGYCKVHLRINGKPKQYRVHRLVAITFIPNPDNLETVNHKDENKQNNDISNLEWMSKQDNINYGTARLKQRKSITGERNGRAFSILQYDKNNNLLAQYPSGADAAKSLNKYPQGIKNINACITGRLKTAYGFIWKKA